MKTKWMIIPVIALTLGCSREIDTNVTYINGEFTLYATSGENDTRTVLQQDGRVFWSPSDCITVFYGNVPGKFTSTNTEPAASAEFTGSLGSFAIDGETEFKAIYPYSNDIVTPTDEGILSIFLPSEQTGVEGTFADDLFICVAKSKDVNLHFYNVCGGVKFSLARGDIKKVVFRGNNGETLAGRMAVEFDSKGIPQVTDMTGGKSSVTLVAPDGGTFKEGVFYYLVLVPQSLTKGYTMELWSDELVETVSSEASVTVRRSAWGVLEGLGATSSTLPDAVDLGLSVKWASFNLGATKPEEEGNYYAWGETESKDEYNWETYIWCEGSENTLTKYCTDAGYGYNGFTDFKTTIEPEDDAAHVHLGGKWRIPTKKEMLELRDSCSWDWTTINGVRCVRFTSKINGNSISMPSNGEYWSSTLAADATYMDDCDGGRALRFWSYYGSCRVMVGSFENRYSNLLIRPVYGDMVIMQSVSLDKTSLNLSVNDVVQLETSFSPSDATNKNVSWLSSNVLVAIVSSTGEVRAVGEGEATVTVITDDGLKTASCHITVNADSSLTMDEKVDLGLPSGLLWASYNLGATKPEEYGDYYAWSGTEAYSITTNSTIPIPGVSNYWISKYCFRPQLGYLDYVDFLDVLDPEDDAAHVHLGGAWRMPTKEEWEELLEYCTWICTTYHGIWGVRITSKTNGNSIFIPSSGALSYNSSEIYYDSQAQEKHCYFWSSSINHEDCGAFYIDVSLNWKANLNYVGALSDLNSYYFINSPKFEYNYYSRTSRLPIRPVYGERIAITGVSIDKTQVDLMVSNVIKLNPIFEPSGAHNKRVIWSSSNPSVATVSSLGVVSCKSPGTAIITVTTEDGGHKGISNVTVRPLAIPDAVDMGLSVKWGSYNLGASSPDEAGNYVSWGEIDAKWNYSELSYKWYDSELKDNTKYRLDSKSSYYDNLDTLEPEDDAAHIHLGGKWRIPSKEEWQELIDNCTWQNQNYLGISGNVYGYKVISNITGNSIFLPETGRMSYDRRYYFMDGNTYYYGMFWARDVYYDSWDMNNQAYYLGICPSSVYDNSGYMSSTNREYGLTIRPVYDNK